MMLLALAHKQRVVQVPVNYHKRVGVSSVTGYRHKAVLLGFEMIALVLRHRLATLPRPRTVMARAAQQPSVGPPQ